jgi:hypothetical protein
MDQEQAGAKAKCGGLSTASRDENNPGFCALKAISH